MKKNNNKGFTLAELLIVVAIIAVLVAIAIPIFTSQLHSARARTDEANARSLYGNLQADYLAESSDVTSYKAASWSAALVDGKTFTGQGTTMPLQDGEQMKLQDTDSTVILHLDPAKGWGVEFKCTEKNISEAWGVIPASTGGGTTP